LGQDGKGDRAKANAGDAAQATRDRDAQADRDVDRARRKLLTTLVYAAPLVVSTVIVKPAHAQLSSCAPASCRPGGGPCGPSGCNPNGGPCGPANCRPRG
jgi:hypothetical protein